MVWGTVQPGVRYCTVYTLVWGTVQPGVRYCTVYTLVWGTVQYTPWCEVLYTLLQAQASQQSGQSGPGLESVSEVIQGREEEKTRHSSYWTTGTWHSLGTWHQTLESVKSWEDFSSGCQRMPFSVQLEQTNFILSSHPQFCGKGFHKGCEHEKSNV